MRLRGVFVNPPDLRSSLKRYFGYEIFRPLQEAIIDDALAGRDVFALLPTVAASRFATSFRADPRGLTVVVSPLIALMKDQVDALTPTASRRRFSIRPWEKERRERVARLAPGRVSLLYVRPERLMLGNLLRISRNGPSD
jgi:ATP-dependent DNA helicase RecQ